MSDTQLDEDIPVIVNYRMSKKDKTFWSLFMMSLTSMLLGTIIGFGAGWIGGYTTGIHDSSKIIEEVFDRTLDGVTVEGHIPW
tara:strand:- start:23266 stop:23514 length:249 start_codon:yes stop_codon:yes gene_type:complete